MSQPTILEERLAREIRRAIDLDVPSELRDQGHTVELGDYDWSTDGQLIGIVVDGARFTLTLERVPC